MESVFLDYPLSFDGRGRTAETGRDDHVRDLIHQVLFTRPGERVNRPDFGCGLLQMVFEPNSAVAATSTQFLVHGALQRWLSDVIKVNGITVLHEDARLVVSVDYFRLDTGERHEDRFASPDGVF